MAPSSSHIGPTWKYDVFVSFRGKDIRKSFVDHLFSDFERKGIYAFKDDKKLKRGEEISSGLYEAIEQSRFLIVIFSNDYASSTWCLRELVKILECKKRNDMYEVRALFYNVTPEVVKNQSGTYLEAFMKHEASKRIEQEPKFIERISNEVFYKLTSGGPLDAGKTTIAKAIYNLLHIHFEAYTFCDDVKGVEKRYGLVHLQEKLLEDLLSIQLPKIRSISKGISILKSRLSEKKVLVVLDGMDNYNQFEALVGSRDWFGPGSVIIVTGRDKQLFSAYGVEEIYEVELLYDDEALELFSLYAFRNKHPKEEFEDLASQVVDYVNGLPLALKILGSSLFGKTVEEWESQLKKLRRYPHCEIQQVLRISYDVLDFDQQNIFLDISCFFKGEKRDYVMKVLNGCDLDAATNIRVLMDMSLISIHSDRMQMHDLVQEMGWQIVHEESEEPGKRSRLWFSIDVLHVLNKDKGTESVKGLAMDVSSSQINIYGKTFGKLNSLRLLNLYIGSWDNLRDVNGKIRENRFGLETKVNAISGRLEYLSSELRLFCWHGFPFPELPLTFYPENLVILDLSYSYIKEIWSGTKGFKKLISMNLSHCRNLIKTPDFTETPNLEELILDGCESLTEVHPSVGTLASLVVLNLRNCTSLVSPPNCTRLKYVQILNLSGCKNLNKFPEDIGIMKALMELHADGTRIDELPYSLSSLGNLQVFTLVFPSLSGLRFLRDIDVSHCNLIEASLDGIECLSMLETLNLSGNDFRSLPSFGKLFRLETLGLVGCKNIEVLPELPPNIQLVEAQDCVSLRELPAKSTTYESSIQCFDFTNCAKVLENQSVENLIAVLLPQGRIDPYKLVSVLLPGSSIPGWFSYQNNGDCVKVELRVRGNSICALKLEGCIKE
ncbi:TMV resistance protein N-like protein [Tanacetum coccineum]